MLNRSTLKNTLHLSFCNRKIKAQVASLLLIAVLSANPFQKLQAQIPAYIPTNGLLAWYPFTGNANDQWVNAHNGTVYGAVLTTDRFNAPNSAYLYNGFSDYISVPDNAANFRPASVTISAWVLFNAIPFNFNMVLAKNVNSNYEESIDLNYSGNGWFCNIGSPNANGPYITSQSTVTVGTWYYLVYQFDDVTNAQSLYVNGIFTASSTVNMSIGYDSQPWTFGTEYENGSLSYFFNGKIDDLAIWDRALSPCEINQMYTGSVLTTTAIANPGSICQGTSAVLSAAGAATYTWNPGAVSGPVISVSPTITTTYSVIGTNSVGCIAQATVNVSVYNKPVLNTGSPSRTICAGSAITLTVSGASTYTWSTSSNNASISVSPAATAIYTVNGADVNGCLGIGTVTIVVNKCITGIFDAGLPDKAPIIAYPNPFNDQLSIELPDQLLTITESISLSLINTLGQTVVFKKIEPGTLVVEVNTKELEKGIYILNIVNNKSIPAIKLVKN